MRTFYTVSPKNVLWLCAFCSSEFLLFICQILSVLMRHVEVTANDKVGRFSGTRCRLPHVVGTRSFPSSLHCVIDSSNK